jgi:hypothetical protein
MASADRGTTPASRAGTQVALGIGCEQAAGSLQRAVMADRGEHVEHFALIGRGVVDAIGRQQRKLQGCGQCALRPGCGVLCYGRMRCNSTYTLRGQRYHVRRSTSRKLLISATRQGRRQRTFVTAGQAHQPLGKLRDIAQQRRALRLCAFAQLVAGNQAAEVLVADAGLGQQAKRTGSAGTGAAASRRTQALAGITHGNLGSNVRVCRPLGRHVKARRAVESVAVEQAIAGISSCAQRAISISGRDAPSRKLNAERAWSSTYIRKTQS